MCRGRDRPGDSSVRVHFAKAVSCSRFVLLARMVTDRRKWNFMNPRRPGSSKPRRRFRIYTGKDAAVNLRFSTLGWNGLGFQNSCYCSKGREE